MKLSPNESRLLDLIPADGSKTNTEALAKKFYGRKPIPFNGRIVITNLCRSLEAKMKNLRGAARVRRGKRTGPKAMEIWRQ